MATAIEKDIDRLSLMDKTQLKQIYIALEEQGAHDLAEQVSFLISAKVAEGIDNGSVKLHDKESLSNILKKHGY